MGQACHAAYRALHSPCGEHEQILNKLCAFRWGLRKPACRQPKVYRRTQRGRLVFDSPCCVHFEWDTRRCCGRSCSSQEEDCTLAGRPSSCTLQLAIALPRVLAQTIWPCRLSLLKAPATHPLLVRMRHQEEPAGPPDPDVQPPAVGAPPDVLPDLFPPDNDDDFHPGPDHLHPKLHPDQSPPDVNVPELPQPPAQVPARSMQ